MSEYLLNEPLIVWGRSDGPSPVIQRYLYDDGGREDAGFKGLVGDCVCRSIAIATKTPYEIVHRSLNSLSKLERRGKRKRWISDSETGVYRSTYERYLKMLGWEFVPTMFIGQGCRVHLRQDELPSGRIVVVVSQHLTALINGVIHDVSDPSRNGTRCVYGYYKIKS